jgi:zinc transporter
MTTAVNWTHLDITNPDAGRRLREDMGISRQVADALLEADTRPRVTSFDEGLLVILRGVNLNPASEVEDMISVRIWLEQDRVITTSRRRLRTIDALQDAEAAGQGAATPGEFLVRIVAQLGEYITQAIEDYEAAVEAAEDSLQESRTVARNSPFSMLRRRAARIRRYLAPQREALDRLSRLQSSLLSDGIRISLGEEANHATMVLEDLDLARERAMVAQEEFLAILAHEQNARMLLLSIIAAIFLPLAFLTGLMGMNVAGLPGTENPAAFWILCAAMTVTAVIILFLFRARRWV